jgi:hypothetical protein
MAKMKSGPDFLCIGLQKAGTRTLHSLLSLDDRFWMPVVKEFHHFDDPHRPREQRHAKVLNQQSIMERGGIALAGWNLARRVTKRRSLTAEDLEFVRRYRAYLRNGCTDADYVDLFSVRPDGRVTGDITPAYSTLERPVIERVQALLPDARIVLLIRDPVSRAWSQGNMILRKELIRRRRLSGRDAASAMKGVVGSDEYLDSLVRRDAVVGRGTPTRIYRRWAEFYGDRIEVVSFDDVCTAQGAVVERLAALFGLPAAAGRYRGRSRIVPDRKSAVARVPMGDREREFLVAHFREELFACRELFGEEKTRGWLETYGLAPERPGQKMKSSASS